MIPALLFPALTTAPLTTPMDEAIAVMRNEKTFALLLAGTITAGRRQIQTSASLYAINDGVEPPKFALVIHRDGVQTRTVTGDGTVLWDYMHDKKQYSALPYPAVQPLPALLSLLKTEIRGEASYPIQLISDIWNGGDEWKPWLPLAQADPTPPNYVLTSGSTQLKFTFGGTNAISQVEMFQGQTHWVMRVLPLIDPAADLFRFTPPSGSAAVSPPYSVKIKPGL